MRALQLHTQTFRYELYLKYDNAKDNRSKFIFGLAGVLCKRKRVKRCLLTSGLVGHTHEDVADHGSNAGPSQVAQNALL